MLEVGGVGQFPEFQAVLCREMTHHSALGKLKQGLDQLGGVGAFLFLAGVERILGFLGGPSASVSMVASVAAVVSERVMDARAEMGGESLGG